MIYGGRLFHVTLFIVGLSTVVAFILLIMFLAVYPKNSPYWVVWLTLFVAVGMGSAIGWATQKWARVGVLFLSLWVGGIFGAILYGAVFYIWAEHN